MQDSQKNQYYRDSRGKMIVLGKFKANRRPVSLENAEFYYNHALSLLKQPEYRPKIRAVRYLKEILLLPDQAGHWQKKAAQAISYYRRFWGDHFTQLENSIHYMRYEDLDKKEIYLYLPHAFLSLRYPAEWKYLEMRMVKEKYTYLHAVMIGRKGSPVEQMVIAYDQFIPLTFIDVAQYKKLWTRRLREKNYQRAPVQPVIDGALANRFSYTIAPWQRPVSEPQFPEQKKKNAHRYRKKNLAGMEYYLRKKNHGYYLALTVEQKQLQSSLPKFHKILQSMQVNP